MRFESWLHQRFENERGKLSVKTIALYFPDKSVEKVLLHGRWRQTRGGNKSPTLLFGNHRDPRLAYESAEEMLGAYFDEIFAQEYSRRSSFWTRKMIRAIQRRVPVQELPLPAEYR